MCTQKTKKEETWCSYITLYAVIKSVVFEKYFDHNSSQYQKHFAQVNIRYKEV